MKKLIVTLALLLPTLASGCARRYYILLAPFRPWSVQVTREQYVQWRAIVDSLEREINAAPPPRITVSVDSLWRPR